MRWRLFCGLAIACLLPLASSAPGREGPKEEAAQFVESAKKLAAAKKFAAAASAMKQAIRLVPKNDLYLAMTSDYEREAGQFADGLKHAQQALALNDKVGAYHALVAANALGTQDLALARKHVLIVLEGGAETYGPVAVNAARALEGQLVKKVHTLTWDMDPKKGLLEDGALRVALPKGDLPYQSVTYKVTGAKSHRAVKGEANDLLLVVPQGTRPFQITMQFTVQPYAYKARLASRKPGPVPAAVRPYLGTSVGINPASPKLAKVAAGLKSPDPVRTVQNVSTWMKKNIAYKVENKGIVKLDFKTAEELLERRSAECLGYSFLFTALCRAANVPARYVWGVYVFPNSGGYASHNWVEVYVTGVGWVPVDPQLPETFGLLPTTHLRVYMPMKKTSKGSEAVPQMNLLYMNDDKLKCATRAESLASPSSSR